LFKKIGHDECREAYGTKKRTNSESKHSFVLQWETKIKFAPPTSWLNAMRPPPRKFGSEIAMDPAGRDVLMQKRGVLWPLSSAHLRPSSVEWFRKNPIQCRRGEIVAVLRVGNYSLPIWMGSYRVHLQGADIFCVHFFWHWPF